MSSRTRKNNKTVASAAAEPVASAAAEPVASVIITTDIKNDPEFKKQLANMAYADLKHDFGHAGLPLTDIDDTVNKGLPTNSEAKWDEDKTIKSVLQNIDLEKISGNDVGEGEVIPFTVGYNEKQVFNYSAQCFKKNHEGDENYGKNFVNTMSLGGEGRSAAIVVDFNQHGFLEKLKRGETADFDLYYLMTPEVINDPAGKSNVTDDELFGANNSNKGVKMVSYLDINDNYTCYLKYDEEDLEPTNMFFSNYDFRLSPIKKIVTKQKAEKLITSLNISLPERPNFVANVEDSKGENSIKTLIGYLKKLLSVLKTNVSNEFNFNSKIQQKRGGDWFQVLCCINARTRLYEEIKPTNKTGQRLPNNCPVYFVTHDRIAVAYALLMGVNVIYLGYYKDVYVFKNLADSSVKPSNKPLEQILLENITSKWLSTGFIDELINTGNGYMDVKKFILNKAKTEYEGACNDFSSKILSVNNNIREYQKTINEKLPAVYIYAVRYAFTKLTLIDINDELTTMKNFLNNLLKNLLKRKKVVEIKADEIFKLYKAAKISADEIFALNKAINTLNSIQEKFGKFSKEGAGENAGINWWINANVIKLDVYKAAGNILTTANGDMADEFFKNRLISVFDKNSAERKIDKHLFLVFLQNNLTTDELIPLKDVIKDLTAKTQEYFDMINEGNNIETLRRGRRLSPNQMFYNIVSNLILETSVIVGDIGDNNNVIFSSSNSDTLMNADLLDMSLILGEGKTSNNTDNDIEFVLKGGRGDYSLFGQSNTINIGLINDISNKQISCRLLVYDMLKKLEEAQAAAQAQSAAQSAAQAQSQAAQAQSQAAPIEYTVEELPKPPSGGALISDYSYVTPIYMIASAILTMHDEGKISNSPDRDNYSRYYGMIKAMFEKGQHRFMTHLYVFFFTANASNLITTELKTFCPVWLLLLNDVYANIVVGSINLTLKEEQYQKELVADPAFKQFVKDCLSSNANIQQINDTLSALYLLLNKPKHKTMTVEKTTRNKSRRKSVKKSTSNKGTKMFYKTRRMIR